MKIHQILGGAIVLVSCLTSGSSAQAYDTIAQSAHTFNATTTLFAVAYSFGSKDRAIDLPIITGRDILGTRNDMLGYTLLDKNGLTTQVGTMHGLVLSDATIVNGRYHIPAGEAANFTLLTFLTTPTTPTQASYKLRVTALPFTFTDHGKTYENHLNPSELTAYTTPLSLLKPGKIVNKDLGNGITINYTTK